MRLDELLLQFLSCDRLDQEPLDEYTLIKLLALARFCPSLENRQPLRYLLAWRPDQIDTISRHLRRGTALDTWPDLVQSDEPAGYIIILGDTRVSFRFDWECRVASQTILLGAVMGGLDGVVRRSIDRAGLQAALDLPSHLEILTIVALGKPRETVVREDGSPDVRPGWRNADHLERVPMRPLSELRIELPGF